MLLYQSTFSTHRCCSTSLPCLPTDVALPVYLVYPRMLLYQSTLCQLPSQKILSTSCSLHALRFWLPICQSHRCRCDTQIDKLGLHPLSCRCSVGRCPRQRALNDVIKRALNTAGFPSILQPTSLLPKEDKRPDKVTLFPFSGGKCLVRHATCINTFAFSN